MNPLLRLKRKRCGCPRKYCRVKLEEHPAREEIVEIAEGEASLGSIARRCEISPEEAEYHCKLLRKAGVLQLSKRGGEHRYHAAPWAQGEKHSPRCGKLQAELLKRVKENGRQQG